jgi:hypothetical protein
MSDDEIVMILGVIVAIWVLMESGLIGFSCGTQENFSMVGNAPTLYYEDVNESNFQKMNMLAKFRNIFGLNRQNNRLSALQSKQDTYAKAHNYRLLQSRPIILPSGIQVDGLFNDSEHSLGWSPLRASNYPIRGCN